MRTINVNMARGHSYENFSTRKFIIRKFPNKNFQICGTLPSYTLLVTQGDESLDTHHVFPSDPGALSTSVSLNNQDAVDHSD